MLEMPSTRYYFIIFFKWLAIASYGFFYLGLILRFVLKDPDGDFAAAR